MNKGFTLIELMVTVLIVGILASIAMPQYRKAVERSRAAEPQVVWNSIVKSANMAFLQRALSGTDLGECDLWYTQASLSSAGSAHAFKSKYFTYTNDTCGKNTIVMTAVRNPGNPLYTLTFTLTKNADLELVTALSCTPGTMEDGCAFFKTTAP